MTHHDWDELERSAEFGEVVYERRRFVVPALIVFVLWFGAFLVLTGYARHFMGTRAVGNVTWAWIVALSVIVLTWAITFAYGRFADRRVHPLVERATERAGGEPRP